MSSGVQIRVDMTAGLFLFPVDDQVVKNLAVGRLVDFEFLRQRVSNVFETGTSPRQTPLCNYVISCGCTGAMGWLDFCNRFARVIGEGRMATNAISAEAE